MPLPLSNRMFLEPDLQDLISHVRGICPETFQLAEELNLFANTWVFGTEPSKVDVRQLLVGALLPRLLSAFQGVVLMAERGMESEAKLLARKVLEVCFRIAAISGSEENARAYIQSDETHRRKFLNKLKSLKTVEHTPSELQTIDGLLKEVTAAIDSNKIQEIGTQWFAERACLMDFYNTAYALLSESAHANVRDLEPLLATDPDGDIEAIEYGPSTGHVRAILLTAIESTILALESAFKSLPGGDVATLARLRAEHARLFHGAA